MSIGLVSSSSLRSSAPDSPSVTLSSIECETFLRGYCGSSVRLWLYGASHSKLLLRIAKPPRELKPIDLLFTATSDIHCPILWALGDVRISDDSKVLKFLDQQADVALTASDLSILVQDGAPDSIWEFQPFGQNA